MFKYKKMVFFLVISVLLIGSGILYTVFSGMSRYNTEKRNLLQDSHKADINKKIVEKNIDENESVAGINEQIENIISGYLDAKLKDDMSGMKKYVNDTAAIDEKKIQIQDQTIESYNNIKCTIKKSDVKDAYRVYVYCDIKAFDVESMLPSLSAYYLRKDSDGSYKIYFGKISSSEQREIAKMDKSDDIVTLKNSVQKRMNELISTDEDVRLLFDELKND